jgi:hypothetical protein
MEREKAVLGLFLRLTRRRAKWSTKAAAAGFYERGRKKLTKLQIHGATYAVAPLPIQRKLADALPNRMRADKAILVLLKI